MSRPIEPHSFTPQTSFRVLLVAQGNLFRTKCPLNAERHTRHRHPTLHFAHPPRRPRPLQFKKCFQPPTHRHRSALSPGFTPDRSWLRSPCRRRKRGPGGWSTNSRTSSTVPPVTSILASYPPENCTISIRMTLVHNSSVRIVSCVE